MVVAVVGSVVVVVVVATVVVLLVVLTVVVVGFRVVVAAVVVVVTTVGSEVTVVLGTVVVTAADGSVGDGAESQATVLKHSNSTNNRANNFFMRVSLPSFLDFCYTIFAVNTENYQDQETFGTRWYI